MSNGNQVDPIASMGGRNNSPVNDGNSTPTDPETRISNLESRLMATEQRALNAERQAQVATRRADKIRDQVFGRINADLKKTEEVLRAQAPKLGLDEATINERMKEARVEALSSLTSDELNAALMDDTPTGPTAPPFPSAQSLAPQQYVTASGQAYPMLPEAVIEAHRQTLLTTLHGYGLTENDLPRGLTPHLGRPESPESQEAFLRDLVSAMDTKKARAAQLGQRMEREGFANEVSQEMEQYANLGGTDVGTGVSPTNGANRLLEQTREKMRNSGRGLEYLARRRQIQERYGSR